jgi:hypothetical protein
MLEQLQTQLRNHSVVLLADFLEAPQLQQFAEIIEQARWYQRKSRSGSLQALDPAHHGLITGQVCQFLSQQQVLDGLAEILGCGLGHFIGNIVRDPVTTQSSHAWHSSFAPDCSAALVVNIGNTCQQIHTTGLCQAVEFQPGDAVLMKLVAETRHELAACSSSGTLLEGYFLSA